MTVQGWNLVLNVVIVVLLAGYGIWLKKVVDQQLKAKDATIETFKAAIRAYEAEIARLKGDTAPAIAEAYQKMRAHADQMTNDSLKLHKDVEALALEKQNTGKNSSVAKSMATVDGLMFAAHELMAAFRPFFATKDLEVSDLPSLVSSLQDATNRIITKATAEAMHGR